MARLFCRLVRDLTTIRSKKTPNSYLVRIDGEKSHRVAGLLVESSLPTTSQELERELIGRPSTPFPSNSNSCPFAVTIVTAVREDEKDDDNDDYEDENWDNFGDLMSLRHTIVVIVSFVFIVTCVKCCRKNVNAHGQKGNRPLTSVLGSLTYY